MKAVHYIQSVFFLAKSLNLYEYVLRDFLSASKSSFAAMAVYKDTIAPLKASDLYAEVGFCYPADFPFMWSRFASSGQYIGPVALNSHQSVYKG